MYKFLRLISIQTALVTVAIYLYSYLVNLHILFDIYLFYDNLIRIFTLITLGTALSILAVGILNKINNDILISYLSNKDSRFKSFIRCIISGFFVHMCNHGILMITANLYKKGVHYASCIAFLLSTPLTSLYVIIIFLSFVGYFPMIIISLASIILALFTYIIFLLLFKDNINAKNSNLYEVSTKDIINEIINKNKNLFSFKGFIETYISGFKSSKGTIKWILISIFISSYIFSFVSINAESNNTELANYIFDNSINGLFKTLAFASIIEICTEGIAPMMGMISSQTNAIGNVFIVLMAGIATDYTELSVIFSFTKSFKHVILFPLVTIPQIMILAYIVNYIFL